MAILTLCDVTRAGLRVLIADMGLDVLLIGQAELFQFAWWAGVDVLVAGAELLINAMRIASEHRLPLLIVAPTLVRGVAIAASEQVRGVVTIPIVYATLEEAIVAVAGGERFLPFDQSPGLSGAHLTAREQELVTLDLQDIPTEQIAGWMDVELHTIYTYRNRIRKKLRGIAPSEQPEWASAWLRRFPGR